jgi:hypothetical protein
VEANEHSYETAAARSIVTTKRGANRSGTDVLELLAPLAAAYIRRAEPGDSTTAPQPATDPSPGAEQTFVACRVEGFVTIDAERRVLWPDAGTGRQACLGLRAVRGAIEVSLDAGPGIYQRSTDQRGRLRLPRGVLRASGFETGDRLVIADSGCAGQLLLVRADRVGVDL